MYIQYSEDVEEEDIPLHVRERANAIVAWVGYKLRIVPCGNVRAVLDNGFEIEIEYMVGASYVLIYLGLDLTMRIFGSHLGSKHGKSFKIYDAETFEDVEVALRHIMI
jgi:hypothetical protein